MRLAIFQHIHHAGQVMFHQLPAAESGLSARQHAGIRGGVDHPVDVLQGPTKNRRILNRTDHDLDTGQRLRPTA